jgi:type I restriction enzyme S subunit
MTPQIKQRIEQIRRGKVPEEYIKIKDGVFPADWTNKKMKQWISLEERPIILQDEEDYELVTVRRAYGGVDSRGVHQGKDILVKTYFGVEEDDFIISKRQIAHGACGLVPSKLHGAVVSNEYNVFKANQGTNIHFFNLMMQLPHYKRLFYLMSDGVHIEKLLFKTGDWMKRSLAMPSLAEQQKIAEILSAQDTLIALKEKLIKEKKRQKKALMQQLLTGKKRLPGFSSAWVDVKLGDVFAERVETNCQDLELIFVTGTNGVVPRSTIETIDTSSEDKSKYLKICKGDIGYNTMRMWQGVSALSEYEGIVSPAYTILIPNPEISAKYFSYLFKMHAVIFLFYRFSQGIVDDTRSLKYYEFTKLHLTVPSDKKEQEAIADILTVADKEIEILKKDLDQEKQKKKALMQLLLTGIVRV